jgi:hypothetical protein
MPGKRTNTKPNCLPSNYDDLPEEEKQKYKSTDDIIGSSLWVYSDIEGLDKIAIETFREFVDQTIDDFNKLSKTCQKKMILNNLAYLLEFRGKIDEIYKTPEWKKFSNILVQYYCFRAVLFNKPIPIVLDLDRSKII